VHTGEITQKIRVERPAPIKNKIGYKTPGKETKYEDLEASRIDSIHFSPDGKTLAIQNFDGVILRDVKRNRILRRIQKTSNSVGSVNFVAFSADSSQIFLLQDEKVYVQDLETGKPIMSFQTDIFLATGISPKGTFLMSGGGGGGVGISKDLWDLKTGKLVRSLKPPEFGAFNNVVFSPDETRLVVSEVNEGVKILDAKSFKEMLDLGKKAKDTTSPVISPDGKTLTTIGSSGRIFIWDLNTGQLIKELGRKNRKIYSLDIDQDSKQLAILSDDDKTRFLDLSSPIEISLVNETLESPYSVFYSTDGNLLFFPGTVTPEDRENNFTNIISIFDRKDNRKVTDLKVGTNLAAMDISRNGEIVATFDTDGVIKVWQTKTGGILHKFKYVESTQPVSEFELSILPSDWSVVLSPNGKWLAADGSGNYGLLIVNLQTGEKLRITDKGLLEPLKFAPDNRTLAIAHNQEGAKNEKLLLYDVIQKQISELDETTKETADNGEIKDESDSEESRRPLGSGFSPDGKFFVRAKYSKEITIWDTESGKQVKHQSLPDWLNFKKSAWRLNHIGFVSINIRNRKILIETTEGNIEFSDANTKKLLASLYIYGEKDWAIVAPDGRFDASEGALGYIHFTDGKSIVMGNAVKSKKFTKGLLQEVLGNRTNK